MLKILALMLLAGFAVGQHIDRGRCMDINIYGYNHRAFCPDGYAAVGLCGSGRHRDCWGANGRLKCCRVVRGVKGRHSNCRELEARYGRYISCDGNRVVTSMCTSLGGPDCGHGYWTRMDCCDDRGLNVDRTNCRWRQAKYGWLQTCDYHEVMVGACTSGRGGDCRGAWTSVYCCALHSTTKSFKKALNPVPDNINQIEEFDENTAIKSPTIVTDDLDIIDEKQVDEKQVEENGSFSEETEE